MLSSDSERHVVNWFEAARRQFDRSEEYQLIDDEEIIEEKAIYEHWPWALERRRNADELRQLSLTADHFDPSVRFVYLNLFYRLAHYAAEQVAVVVEDQDEAAGHRRQFELDLQVLVELIDVEQCKDARQIRWEIVNACAVYHFDRALRLAGQFGAPLPASTVHYHRGRLNFLIALRKTWEGEAALDHWDLPLGKRPGGDRGVWQCLNALRLHTSWSSRHFLNSSKTISTLVSEIDLDQPSCPVFPIFKKNSVQSNTWTCELPRTGPSRITALPVFI